MTWLYGFMFKYQFVKRIGEELGFHNKCVSIYDSVAKKHIRRVTQAPFIIDSDYRGHIILQFHATRRKGDLAGMRATPAQIKAVGMILFGDGQEHEPSWFTNNPDDAPSDDSDDDDPLPPQEPMEFYKEIFPHLYGDTETSNSIHVQKTAQKRIETKNKDKSPRYDRSSRTNEDKEEHRPSSLAKKTRKCGRRLKIVSAGRVRKIHIGRA